MQFALIVQLSIAMLARELAGGLPIGALGGAAVALCGPLAVFVLGSIAAISPACNADCSWVSWFSN